MRAVLHGVEKHEDSPQAHSMQYACRGHWEEYTWESQWCVLPFKGLTARNMRPTHITDSWKMGDQINVYAFITFELCIHFTEKKKKKMSKIECYKQSWAVSPHDSHHKLEQIFLTKTWFCFVSCSMPMWHRLTDYRQVLQNDHRHFRSSPTQCLCHHSWDRPLRLHVEHDLLLLPVQVYLINK